MFTAASSSKTVLEKLFPPLSGPPGCWARFTVVPSGPVTSSLRSPTQPCVMPEMLTSRSLIRSLLDGTLIVDVTPVALSSGIAIGPPPDERGIAGPAKPVGSTMGMSSAPPSAVVTLSVAVMSDPHVAPAESCPS